MKVILTMGEQELNKVRKHLKIVHKCASTCFSGMIDATIEIQNVNDAAALYVAGKETAKIIPIKPSKIRA